MNGWPHREVKGCEYQVFLDQHGGKTVLAGASLAWLRSWAVKLGMSPEETWRRMIDDEDRRLQRFYRRN